MKQVCRPIHSHLIHLSFFLFLICVASCNALLPDSKGPLVPMKRESRDKEKISFNRYDDTYIFIREEPSADGRGIKLTKYDAYSRLLYHKHLKDVPYDADHFVVSSTGYRTVACFLFFTRDGDKWAQEQRTVTHLYLFDADTYDLSHQETYYGLGNSYWAVAPFYSGHLLLFTPPKVEENVAQFVFYDPFCRIFQETTYGPLVAVDKPSFRRMLMDQERTKLWWFGLKDNDVLIFEMKFMDEFLSKIFEMKFVEKFLGKMIKLPELPAMIAPTVFRIPEEQFFNAGKDIVELSLETGRDSKTSSTVSILTIIDDDKSIRQACVCPELGWSSPKWRSVKGKVKLPDNSKVQQILQNRILVEDDSKWRAYDIVFKPRENEAVLEHVSEVSKEHDGSPSFSLLCLELSPENNRLVGIARNNKNQESYAFVRNP